jgi:ATP-dependent protease ClpP protease subunit
MRISNSLSSLGDTINGTSAIKVKLVIHNDITNNIDECQDLLSRMRIMSERDKLVIHLSTGGGYVDAGTVILNAIKSAKKKGVHVTTVLESHAHSMGTMKHHQRRGATRRDGCVRSTESRCVY